MPAMELLTPWFTFVVVLLPVLYLERWIHQHLYGVGWLLSRDKQRATILYYLILLPGVFLHEFTQWLVAGALSLKTAKIKLWPKPQTNGTLRLDFVKLSGKRNSRTRVTVFETSPLVVGILVIWYISQRVLDTSLVMSAFQTGDLGLVFYAFRTLLGTPDFWLWLYLLFAVGNAMFPTDNLNLSWLFTVSIAVGAFLLTIGLLSGSGVVALRGPLSAMLDLLATAAGTMLVMNLLAVLLLGLFERILERATGMQAKYPQPQASKVSKPEPGGETPLPEDQAPARIADRKLPIPPPPKSSSTTKAKASVPPPDPVAPVTRMAQSTGRPSWVELHSQPTSETDDETEKEKEEVEELAAPDDTSEVKPNGEEEAIQPEDNDEPRYVDVDSDIA